MSFLASIGSVIAQPGVQAIAAGLLSGAIGGTALVVSGALPIGPGDTPPATLAIVACPGSGPALGTISDGQRVLAIGRSEDGEWLELYVGFPGLERGWAPTTALNLESTADTLPVAACEAPTPSPRQTVGATVEIPTASPGGSPTQSPPPSLEPSLSPSPSPSPSPSLAPSLSPSPTIRPSASPTVKPTATPTKTPVVTPSPTPSPSPTPTPTTNPPPSLSGLTSSQKNFCQSGDTTITVTATDPNGIAFVRIRYSTPGSLVYGPYNMTHMGGSTYAYVLNPTGLTEGFISITITSADTQGALSQLNNVDDVNDPSSVYVQGFC